MDLDALDEYLESGRAPDDSMQLSKLDGFLTGIAIAPEFIAPNEWLPLVWGNTVPEFKSRHEADNILGLIMARQKEIVRDIKDGIVEPIFMYEGATVLMSDWLDGFLWSMSLRKHLWAKMMETSARLVLLPIMEILGGERIFRESWTEKQRQSIKLAIEALPDTVLAMSRYWELSDEEKRDFSRMISSQFQLRHKDPCPCGSGDVFGKCCGAVPRAV